jgi:hypothetical protein
MNLHLGLRILALLAFVAASTTVIVRPDLIKGVRPAHAPVTPGANALLVVGAAWAPSQTSPKHLEIHHGQT